MAPSSAARLSRLAAYLRPGSERERDLNTHTGTGIPWRGAPQRRDGYGPRDRNRSESSSSASARREDLPPPHYRPPSPAPTYRTVDPGPIPAPAEPASPPINNTKCAPPPTPQRTPQTRQQHQKRASTSTPDPRLALLPTLTTALVASTSASQASYAIAHNDARLFTSILNSGFDVDVILPSGGRLLHLACALGRTWMVHVLLAAGANGDVVDGSERRYKPLQYASRNGHLGTLEVLIFWGVDVYGVYPTALELAAGRGHVAVVRRLLEVWVYPVKKTFQKEKQKTKEQEDTRDNYVWVSRQGGCTMPSYAGATSAVSRAAEAATRNGHRECTRLLHTLPDSYTFDKVLGYYRESDTLRGAIKYGWPEIVAEVLLPLANRASGDDSGTDISSSEQIRSKERAQVLLARLRSDERLFDTAVTEGTAQIVEVFLQAGWDANVAKGQAANQRYPLVRAVKSNATETARVLLDYGADISILIRQDKRILRTVVESGPVELVRLLVERGLDMDHALDNEPTPWEVARKYRGPEVWDILAGGFGARGLVPSEYVNDYVWMDENWDSLVLTWRRGTRSRSG
ncbi:ankyrin repeat-containing domain protein [Aspergillus germanicus]